MTKNNKAPVLYIDRHPMLTRSWEISRDIDYDYLSPSYIHDRYKTEIKFSLLNGTEITFSPTASESKEGGIYLYGLLESLFPNIARDYYLEDWKVAYLQYSADKKQLASQAIHRYTIDKNDNRFNTKEAKAFKAGYDVRNKK